MFPLSLAHHAVPTASVQEVKCVHTESHLGSDHEISRGDGIFLKKNFPARDEAKKKNGPNPAIKKKVRLNYLKVTM